MPRKKKITMEVDYSSTLETELPRFRDVALKDGNLPLAIESLFQLEKQTRQGGDFTSTKKVARSLVKLCFDCSDYQQLNNSLLVLSKRRGQENQVIQAAVQETMDLIDSLQDLPTKLSVIDTLRTITEGKIFVELERATLTRTLAKIMEAQGNLKEAARILQEVQVETLGKMEKIEKIDYILEQIRLCLDSQDFLRANILSRKINPTALQPDDCQELKLRFYELMIRYYSHIRDFLQICRSYQHIYTTPIVQDSPQRREEVLKMISLYAVLSPYGPEQSDIVHRVFEDKNLETLGPYKALLKYFLTMELMRWPTMQELYRPVFSTERAFSEDLKLWDDLHSRVIEHNIRVLSSAYTRIRTERFSSLLDLDSNEAEKRLSEMVVQKSVFASIDRPAGIISFTRPKAAAEVLNEWSGNVSELLSLLEKTCHLIHRETMVHTTKAK